MASGKSVGKIYLDLAVNDKGFDKQLNGIGKIAGKIGKTIAAAFVSKQLYKFGKECTDLASDLQEVQNVVDVTFPNMTAQIDTFAKNAAAKLGLSETMAKKFVGTTGAMAKAFGFSEKEAASMATTLTSLAGDVASFYNITQDEAFTKLKSVFTGETESLKELGVVMTQSALDAYALEKGFGKTTSAMSEAEKVALRYAFVQEKLSAASGDFSRTSGGWANQLRILNLQFDTLKSTIGEGLIAAFTPVIRVINAIIQRLITLATYFSAFTKALFGEGDSADEMSEGYDKAQESVSGVTSSLGKMASAAKKAMGLAGFDELNVLNKSDDSNASGSGAGIPELDVSVPDVSTTVQMTGVEAAAEKIREKITSLINFLENNTGGIVAKIAGMAAAIGTYLGAINFSTFAGKIVDAGQKIATFFGSLGSSISLPALVIAAVVGLIVAGIVDLWNTSETFRNNMKDCWELLGAVFAQAWTMIWENGLKPLIDALAELGKTLYSFYEESGLKTLFEIVMTGIAYIVTLLASALVATVAAVVKVLLNLITMLVNAITGILNAVLWLKENWLTVWSTLKTGVVKIFEGIWNGIKWYINLVIGGVEHMVNRVIRGVNRIIQSINSLSFDIPDWDVFGDLAGKTFGLSIPEVPEISLPKLAQGGYVEANTPRLVMIGDNTHYGEIVSPENKMYEVTYRAMADVMRMFMTQLAGMQNGSGPKEIKLVVSGELAPFFRWLKMELDKENVRTGTNFEVIYT